MAIYNLEESPDLYIVPRYYHNRFLYQMVVVTGEMNRRVIRTIDLRSDKLLVYGTEIKLSVLERLHQSLVLRPKQGVVYVNCNGACYFLVPAKGCCRPIHNTIFDWSQFGVVVPNSLNDSLRRQLEEMEQLLSSAKAEAVIAKASLEASMKDMEELKEQLSTYEKEKQDREAKLEEVCGQCVLLDFALQTCKSELESSKKEVEELRDQLSRCKKESQSKETELKKVRDKLSSMTSDSKLKSMTTQPELSTTQPELSKKRVMELEKQVSITREESRNREVELQRVRDQLSSAYSELESTKKQLGLSTMSLKELETQLSSCRKENEEIKMVFQKLQVELSSVHFELGSTKAQLESSKKTTEELQEQLFASERENQYMKAELHKLQDQLSAARDELESTKAQLESSQQQVQELQSQSCICKKDHQGMELELQKMSDHLLSIDSVVKSSNQKLDQLLNCLLWKEFPDSTADLPIFTSIEEHDQEVSNDMGVDTT